MIVDCFLSPPSWQEWIKLLNNKWNRSCLLIIFSNNLSNMFRNTMRQKNLEESYDDLFGLEIMTVVDVLKWEDHSPRLMQALVMSINLDEHSEFLTIILICFHKSLSGLGAKELLYFSIVHLSSSLKKEDHRHIFLSDILSRRLGSIWQF